MATNPREIEEKDGTRKIILLAVGVVSLLLVAALIYVARSPSTGGGGPAQLEGAMRAGSPEFDKYKALITVDAPEATEGARAIGDIVMTLTTTVRNFTGRTINGLEMRATVVDIQGNPVKERNAIVIPNTVNGTTELEHNKTLPVRVTLEGMKKEDDRANIKMELIAIRFK